MRVSKNCNVPQRGYPKDPQLGRWVKTQRMRRNRKFKRKKTREGLSIIGPEELRHNEHCVRLDSIGFRWRKNGNTAATAPSSSSSARKTVRWEQRYEELKAYKEENGDCLVPSKYSAKPQLANWVTTQRTGYRLFMEAKEAGEPTSSCYGMTEERISLLNEVGFAWTANPKLWGFRLVALRSSPIKL